MGNIGPQPGKQEMYLSSVADVVFYGGAAGAGKTYANLLECLRNIHNPDFGAVIFRKNLTHIIAQGGLFDESKKLFPILGGEVRENPKIRWTFPAGSKVTFDHMQHDKNMYDWQGSQIPLIIFDEITHFSEKVFWYMFSRNRTTCGVRPYMRATCNPDPDSWVAKFIEWWIDWDTGYPIEERAGVVRYFIRIKGELVWADSKEELIEKYEGCEPKSFTFIGAKLDDNKILMKEDPGYRASLLAMPEVEREQLLKGNWKIKPAPGFYFKSRYFKFVDYVPDGIEARGWDLASTDKEENDNSNYTASVKMVKDRRGDITITDCFLEQLSPAKVEQLVINTSSQDGPGCIIRMPQDPGQAGVAQRDRYKKLLMRYNVKFRNMREDKIIRALPMSSASESGFIRLLRAPWNKDFIQHAEQFPPEKGSPDVIDAGVEAFDEVNDSIDMGLWD